MTGCASFNWANIYIGEAAGLGGGGGLLPGRASGSTGVTQRSCSAAPARSCSAAPARVHVRRGDSVQSVSMHALCELQQVTASWKQSPCFVREAGRAPGGGGGVVPR